MKTEKKFLIKTGCIFGISIIILFFYYLFYLNHININELGVFYDSGNGKLTVETNAGWYRTSPMVQEINISLVPFKVHPLILSHDANIINEKIIRFNMNGIGDFIKREGFGYMTSTYFQSLLTSYAYSNQKYSFLDIVQEVQSND